MSVWEVVPLSDLLVDAKPGFACGEDPEDGVFQFRMNNVTTEGQLDFSKKRRVPRETRGLEAFLVEPGDVLFNATNSPELVGKSAFFPGHGEPAVFSNHFLRLRPRADQLHGRFLARWLMLQFQRRVFQCMCRQWVNQATVGREALLAIRIPLPPLPEQRQIADVLDRADALRANRRAVFAHFDALTEAVFLEMFGDPGANPKGWSAARLGDVIYSASDGPHVSPAYVEEGVPFLSTRHVRREGIVWEDLKYVSHEEAVLHWKKCKPERGDVLYTKGGTTGVAKVVDFDRPVAIWVHIALLKTDKSKVEPLWLESMLNSPFCYRQSQQLTRGIANRDLGLTRMVKIKMYLPPLVLQREFAHRIKAVERLKAVQRASLAAVDALFASLQHRAFRGDL